MCMEGEPPDFFSESRPKARKEHQCDECLRAIAVGEKYRRGAGKWDGEICVRTTCSHCSVGMDLLGKECEGWVYEMVAEDLETHISEILPWSEDAKRLVEGMRRKWRDWDGTLMPIPTLTYLAALEPK